MSKLNCYVAGIPRVCSYHLATERVKRKGGGSGGRDPSTGRKVIRTWRLEAVTRLGIEIWRARERRGCEPQSSGLLSRVPSGFETGCNVIFDNVLIRRDLCSVGAFNIMAGDRGNYRV